MQLQDIIPTGKTIALEDLAKDKELAKQVQVNLTRMGLLDPPADGKFGRFSTQALQDFKSLMKISEPGFGSQTTRALRQTLEAIPLQLGNDFASQIIKYMRSKQYYIAVGANRYNIVYVEGADKDGTPNKDTFNQWNDRRLVIEVADGVPKFVGNWLATTEPGRKPTINGNPKGAARIAFGQYQAWQVGMHPLSPGSKGRHEALRQIAPIKVYRDRNKDGIRPGDQLDEGVFGINQHWGYDMKEVENASAGCLVGQSREGHVEFMTLIKQDSRYQINPKYLFFTTVIAGNDLAKSFPVS